MTAACTAGVVSPVAAQSLAITHVTVVDPIAPAALLIAPGLSTLIAEAHQCRLAASRSTHWATRIRLSAAAASTVVGVLLGWSVLR